MDLTLILPHLLSPLLSNIGSPYPICSCRLDIDIVRKGPYDLSKKPFTLFVSCKLSQLNKHIIDEHNEKVEYHKGTGVLAPGLKKKDLNNLTLNLNKILRKYYRATRPLNISVALPQKAHYTILNYDRIRHKRIRIKIDSYIKQASWGPTTKVSRGYGFYLNKAKHPCKVAGPIISIIDWIHVVRKTNPSLRGMAYIFTDSKLPIAKNWIALDKSP